MVTFEPGGRSCEWAPDRPLLCHGQRVAAEGYRRITTSKRRSYANAGGRCVTDDARTSTLHNARHAATGARGLPGPRSGPPLPEQAESPAWPLET